MKRINEPIRVQCDGKKVEAVYWRGRRIKVHGQVNAWVVRSRWWGADEKRIYRTLETGKGFMEVYQVGNLWRLSRLAD
jgi:hypothetical protein